MNNNLNFLRRGLACLLFLALVLALPMGALASQPPEPNNPPIIEEDHPAEAGEVMLFK